MRCSTQPVVLVGCMNLLTSLCSKQDLFASNFPRGSPVHDRRYPTHEHDPTQRVSTGQSVSEHTGNRTYNCSNSIFQCLHSCFAQSRARRSINRRLRSIHTESESVEFQLRRAEQSSEVALVIVDPIDFSVCSPNPVRARPSTAINGTQLMMAL